MSKVRPTIGTDGLALPILPPERDARVWARLVRVMFYTPGFMGLLLIKTGEPASFGITVELLMLSSAAAVVGGLFIGSESSGAGADHSSRIGTWSGSMVIELLGVVPFLAAVPALFHELAHSALLHSRGLGEVDVSLGCGSPKLCPCAFSTALIIAIHRPTAIRVPMFSIIAVLTGTMLRVFRTRRNLLLENLTLRQQLAALKRKHPRPRLSAFDRFFWVLARRFWSRWKQALILVGPETVARWHRSGFAFYWHVISKARRVTGRRRISKEVRDLIFRMVTENPTWGAPRIHGELLMLGFDVSERTISRWMRRAPRDPEPAKRWLAFLRNHREAIAAMDFFTVPTITFGVLYCFFIIGHDRRRILYFHVTRHPTSLWVVQQLREAFPYETAPRFLIFDRDAKYGTEVPAAIRSMNIKCVRTSFESPWQNGIAERWVQSCRRDLLNHVIALNEAHLRRLLSDYVRYYHEDRTHLGLKKETPTGRIRSLASGRITARARLGGLHHRYDRAA